MTRSGCVVAAVLLAVGVVTSACGGSSDSATQSTTSANVDLQSLIPTPPASQKTDGPQPDDQNGIHMHFVVGGAPQEVMAAYKKALEGKGWILSVADSSGGGPYGGASYRGTNGGAFGLFGGGGYSGSTEVNSCVWPARPTDIHCG